MPPTTFRRARRDQADQNSHSIPVSCREPHARALSIPVNRTQLCLPSLIMLQRSSTTLGDLFHKPFCSAWPFQRPVREKEVHWSCQPEISSPASVPKSSHLVAQAKHAHHSRSDLLLHPEQELLPSCPRETVPCLVAVDVQASPARCRRGSLSSRVDT